MFLSGTRESHWGSDPSSNLIGSEKGCQVTQNVVVRVFKRLLPSYLLKGQHIS